MRADSALAEPARKLEVAWNDERAARNWALVRQRQARRARARALGAGAAALLSAAALALFFFGRSAPAPVSPVASAPEKASGQDEPKTTFADGSVARVSAGGELLVELAGADHVESVLTKGAADFDVTKNPRRDFVVVAGQVRVRVVGTRFRVERSGERTRVAVSQGKVEVQDGDSKVYLEAGESRFFPSEPPLGAVEPRPAIQPRTRFLELARGGDFKAAYQVMSQSPAAVGSSAEELMLAADAARLSNHPEQALGYLRRVTAEHSGDSRAPLAAFTQGRVLLSQLSRPAEAAEAFALVRRLRPAGSLAEDALAREAEARAASGGRAQARTLAAQYLSRYPQGKHGENMRRLTTGQ
jgi:transmembrane sensor